MNNNKQFYKPISSDISYFVKSYSYLTKKLRTKNIENRSLNVYLSNVEELLNKVSHFKSPQKEEEFIKGCLLIGNKESNISKIAA